MSLSAIEGWVSEIQQTMSGLPAALAAAAPTGDFGAVLSSAIAVLDPGTGGPAGEVTTASDPASSVGAASGTASIASSAGAGTASQTTGAPEALSPAVAAPEVSGAGAVSGTAAPAGAAQRTGQQVVDQAERYLGVPYVWGGTTPAGFDCSGLVQYVYGSLGMSVPRTSEAQATVGTPVAGLAQARPGDLVFFPGSDGTAASPGHVGIYLGGGEMIDAPHTGTQVSIQPVGDPTAIRRVLPGATLGTTDTTGTTDGTGGTAPLAARVDAAEGTVAATATGSTATPATGSLTPLFLAAAKTYGVPADLLTAVAEEESHLSPGAVSPAGAEGLMQLMPSTAASLGVNAFDPAQAIDGAAELLSGYLQRFGSVQDALAAYNAGPAAVEQYGGVPPYAQTQAYVQGVLQDLATQQSTEATPTTQQSTEATPTTQQGVEATPTTQQGVEATPATNSSSDPTTGSSA